MRSAWSKLRNLPPSRKRWDKRKGGFIIIGITALIVGMTFVGFTVDLGLINVTKARMQATADACALAAVKEIQVAINEVGQAGGEGSDVQSVTDYSAGQAAAMAANVAELNGLYVDENQDVRFGKRTLNEDGTYSVQWGTSPYNVVEVTIRKDNDDSAAPDAKLDLFFSPLYGDRRTTLSASAAAYIESRDIVAVLDFSGSMAYDSLPFISGLSTSAVRDNLDDIWDALVASNVTFSDDASTLKFPAGGFGLIDSEAGEYYTSTSVSTVFDHLELSGDGDPYYTAWEEEDSTYYYTWYSGRYWRARKSDGELWRKWRGWWYWKPYFSGDTSDVGGEDYVPFPQEGSSNGVLNGKPSQSESESMWRDYIDWVIDESTGNTQRLYGSGYDYRYQYGYRTLMMYLLYQQANNDESEDLWRVPAYPFQAVKDGMTLFTGFLDGLSFGDTLGLVSYATTAQRETGISDAGADETVDLGTEHMTSVYSDINTIQLQKQPAHYSSSTNIGDGLKEAKLLLDEQARDGSQRTILLMTDGIVNKPDSIPSLPSGWSDFDWDEMTDWDGDGVANYDETDLTAGYYDDQKRYLWYQAVQAVEAGYTINTFAVGDDADTDLMKAIAHYGGGQFMEAEGGSQISDLEEELLEKFSLLASDVPDPELLPNEE